MSYLGNPNAHNFGTLIVGLPFLKAVGSRNRFSATSCDQLPLMLASYLMYGHQLLLPIPDVDRTDFMMLIGANPLVSNGSIMAAPGIKQRLEDWEILNELRCRPIARRHGKLSKQYPATRAMQKAGPERMLGLGLGLGPYGERFNPFATGLSLGKLRKTPHGVDPGPLQPSLPARLPEAHGLIDLAPDLFVKDLLRLRDRLFRADATRTDGQLLLIGRRHPRRSSGSDRSACPKHAASP